MDTYYSFDEQQQLAVATTVVNGLRVRLTSEGQFRAGQLILNGQAFTVSEAIDRIAAERPDLTTPLYQ